MNSLSQKAYAKINLTLDVTGIMPNGYHSLRTVMQTVSLFDTVTVTLNERPSIQIFCDEVGVPTDERNTCYKAAKLFFEAVGETDCGAVGAGADIHIKKNIPSMAGLGGGSADSAAVLRILNILLEMNMSTDRLCEIAVRVGADVPFLINGGTALCEGVGEKITPIPYDAKHNILLVQPDFGISTPFAYKSFDEKKLKSADMSTRLISAMKNGEAIYGYLSNDLETAVADEKIIRIKQELKDCGAKASMMTGSGSCVYGLFDSENDCLQALNRLSGRYAFAYACKTI